MTMEQILEKIKQDRGEAVLGNGRLLAGLFADYSRGQLRPQANALDIFLKCEGNTRVLALRGAPEQKQRAEFHRLLQEIVRDYGMQEEVARRVSAAFWRAAIGTEPPVPAGEPAPVREPSRPAPKAADSTLTAEEMYRRGIQCNNAKKEPLQSWQEAVQWFEKAAALNHVGAQNYLGRLYACSRAYGYPENPEKSAYWYRKAAEQGDGFSQRQLGSCYESGYGVPQDYSQAVYWYRKAAENEKPPVAQKNLARLYRYRLNDPAQAVYWYRKAAQWDKDSQLELGRCYENGYGTAKDDSQALYWYRKAAEADYRPAQRELSRCYREGIGTAKDPAQADYWQRKANGDSPKAAPPSGNVVSPRK